jgi:two-component system, LytTR family, response regulator
MGHLKTTTVIVDDEAHAGQLLQKLLDPFPLFGNISLITNSSVAFTEIVEQQPKFLFLDIEMPGMNGLQLSEKIKLLAPNTKVIYVTAFEQYALDAIRQNAFDYLLKPVDRAELVRVVEKLLTNREPTPINGQRKHLLVRSNEGIYQVAEDDIIFLEADSSYTTLVLQSQPKILCSSNLGKIMPSLSENRFIRISRKHMVNRSYISFYHAKKKYLLLKTPDKEFRLKVLLKVHDLKELLSIS